MLITVPVYIIPHRNNYCNFICNIRVRSSVTKHDTKSIGSRKCQHSMTRVMDSTDRPGSMNIRKCVCYSCGELNVGYFCKHFCKHLFVSHYVSYPHERCYAGCNFIRVTCRQKLHSCVMPTQNDVIFVLVGHLEIQYWRCKY